MKMHILRRGACAILLGVMLTGSAFAATEGYTTDVSGIVTYDKDNDSYNAIYQGENSIVDGKEYVILVVKGTPDNYTISKDTILYIDQVTASETTISFNFIPMTATESVVLLGGEFQNGNSPIVLGTLLSNGTTVTGQITAYAPKTPTTIELYAENDSTKPVYTTTIGGEANASGGQKTQTFSFEGVTLGTYNMKVTKAGHTPCWLNHVPVGSEALDISQTINSLTLVCGDVNGDGKVNANDYMAVANKKNYNKAATEADNALCDVNGDGKINATDYMLIANKKNYNKGVVEIDYE